MRPRRKLMARRWAGIAILAAAAVTCASSAQTLSLNLPEAFAPVKAKLASGQTARMVVIGDSLAFREGSWLPEFRALMHNAYGDAGLGYMAFGPWSGAQPGPDFMLGLLGQDTVPHRALDGMWAVSPAAAGSCVYHAGSARRLTLMTAGGPGAGVVTAHPAGRPNGVLDTSSSVSALRTLTITNSAGLGDVTFTTEGGPVTFLGVSLESDLPGVLVHRVANGGWGVNNYLQRDWSFDAELSSLAPDLVWIWLGQNDLGTPLAEYQDRMGQLVDRVLADAPGSRIVLVGSWDVGSTFLTVLVQAVTNLATDRALGFINLFAAGGTRAFYVSSGYTDGLHFSPAGGAYVGGLMFDAFQTDGTDFCDVHFVFQPAPCAAHPGHTASFYTLACAGTGESYRWRRDGLELIDNDRVLGSNTELLIIADVRPGDEGIYDVVVTGRCGTAASQGAPLTVLPLCPADINADGFVAGDDFDAFVDEFYWGTAKADYNGDGFTNGDDFDGFIEAFVTGC